MRTQTFIRTLKRAEKIFERISDLKQLTNTSHVWLGGMTVYAGMCRTVAVERFLTNLFYNICSTVLWYKMLLRS